MTILFLAAIAILLAVGYATDMSLPSLPISTSLPLPSGKSASLSSSQSSNPTGVSVYQSNGSLTGSAITNDQSTWPGDDPIWNICQGVALAEGYNVLNSVPYDLNNPGDLSPGDEAGQSTCGGAQSHSGSLVIVFCAAENGWNALYTKFTNIVNGTSMVYSSSWTWTQVAQKYAGNWQDWLNNVTGYLGVDPSSTPAQYVNGIASA
jgi:hypothetical protein